MSLFCIYLQMTMSSLAGDIIFLTIYYAVLNILNKSENATPELCAIFIQNDASQ